VFIIEHEYRPIGWIQWYRWSDFPEHAAQLKAEPGAAGIDLSIGEIASIGKGLGSCAIREFVSDVVCSKTRVTAIVADPEEQNRRSWRAFEKAGFVSIGTVQVRKETVWRRVMRLSLPGSMGNSSIGV
jgi:aminoglycoside 6'-N-acetyltransferase